MKAPVEYVESSLAEGIRIAFESEAGDVGVSSMELILIHADAFQATLEWKILV